MTNRTNQLLALLRHHELIRMMVGRDLSARYRGSFVGMGWAILQPLAMLLLYTFVFSLVLKVKFGVQSSPYNFALYLFCGMLPWLAISDAIGRATTVVGDHANLVKKVVFPLEVLPTIPVVSALVSQLIGTGVFIAVLLALGKPLQWVMLLLPLLLVPQFLFSMGIAWLVASLGVFFRDLGQAIGLLLTTWMFMTPIFYPAESIPSRFKWVMALNPLAVLIQLYRQIFLEGQPPNPLAYLGLLGFAGLVFGVGLSWFNKTKRSFADVI